MPLTIHKFPNLGTVSNAEKQYNFRNEGVSQVVTSEGKFLINPNYKSSLGIPKDPSKQDSMINKVGSNGSGQRKINDVYMSMKNQPFKIEGYYGLLLFVLAMILIFRK